MSVAILKEKIMADAKADAEIIMSRAKDEAAKILQEGEKEYEQLRSQVDKDATRLADEKYQNITTLARVDSKNKLLAAKRKMIDLAFEKARRKLEELSGEEFATMMMRLLKDYPAEKETGLIVGRKSRLVINESFLAKVNASGNGAGRYVIIESERDFDYGLYIVTDWMEIDLTLDGILRNIREEIEMDVIKILFEKG